MAHFIKTTAGFINLDHVVRIERGELRLGIEKHTLHTVNGDRIECQFHMFNLDSIEGGAVFPAAPGTVAIVIFVEDGSPERPTEEAMDQQEEPILGWRDVNGYLAPVFLHDFVNDGQGYDCTPLLPIGNRFRVLGCTDGLTFDSLEEARQFVLSSAQSDWDRQQQK